MLTSVEDVDTATALWIGLGLAVACLLVAGLLRYPWAYWLGWAVQVAAIALGFVVTTMFVLGAIFLALWATAYFLGRKIEVERASGRRRGSTPASATEPGRLLTRRSGRPRAMWSSMTSRVAVTLLGRQVAQRARRGGDGEPVHR